MDDSFAAWSGTQGFQILCTRLRPELLRFSRWLTRNAALAEDLVQESLLRAWKSRQSLQNECALKAWLCTIVRREYARTFERRRLVLVDVDLLVATEEAALATTDDAEVDDIREALHGLPERYRRPLEMQVILGCSVLEIGAELQLSRAAVLTRLFRARKHLRVACGYDRNDATVGKRRRPRADAADISAMFDPAPRSL